MMKVITKGETMSKLREAILDRLEELEANLFAMSIDEAKNMMMALVEVTVSEYKSNN